MLLPWERLLWSQRPWWPAGARYALTDFRVVRVKGRCVQEIAVHDIREVQSVRSRLDRVAGTVTLLVYSRDRRQSVLAIRHVRRGSQLAALLELLAGVPDLPLGPEAISTALTWRPHGGHEDRARALAGLVVVLMVALGVTIAVRGDPPVRDSPDTSTNDGARRDRHAIVTFMETTVMPWARTTLGPLKGGAENVSCETCHGLRPESLDWRMPAVTALPEPQVRRFGLEIYQTGADAQMRNAIYGYLAEPDNQAKAAYMREVVMPGMARLLHRSAYDFTKTYEYNTTRRAFGCYHCHRVT